MPYQVAPYRVPVQSLVDLLYSGETLLGTVSLRSQLTALKELVGRHAHKFFPEWNGICLAHVISYDAKNKLWLVKYEADNETEEFDHNDMVNYVET